jgi:hypothetical protein
MNLKNVEHQLAKDAKAEYDYVTNPDNCGKVVRNNFNGIIIFIYGFIILALAASIGGVYVYTQHQKVHKHPIVHQTSTSGTQPQ